MPKAVKLRFVFSRAKVVSADDGKSRNGTGPKKRAKGGRRKKHPEGTKPPFGYYGAKQRMAPEILETLPPHNAWVEAFCGSAAITLAKAPAPIEVINDLDGNIINLFRVLRRNPTALARAIELTPYARDEFITAGRQRKKLSQLERARRFLARTMMTVNGDAEDAGFS